MGGIKPWSEKLLRDLSGKLYTKDVLESIYGILFPPPIFNHKVDM